MEFDKIDIVTTATLRPELLRLTYKSFHRKLFYKYKSCRLIINIDPLPSPDQALFEEVLLVCREWFSEVVFRYPEVPSFPAAVQWAWGQVKTPIFFHLEDDWLLLRPVDPLLVSQYFSQQNGLAEVTLNPSKNRPEDPGLALRPSFFRQDFISAALPLFNLLEDPEKQWRKHIEMGGVLDQWKFRHYGEIGEGHYVRDMGALWRKMYALEKWGLGDVSWNKRQYSLVRMLYYKLKFVVYKLIYKATVI